jgi:ligand-binding sensor protein
MEFNFLESINLDILKDLFYGIYKLNGLHSGILDLDGKVIINDIDNKDTNICSLFHTKCPQTHDNCIESDSRIVNEILKTRDQAIYKCKNGLVDAAVPIILKENI